MPRKYAVIACTIACLVACSCLIPTSASIDAQEEVQGPWTFGAGWSFTWMIHESSAVFQRNTRLRLTVIEIRPILSGTTVIARHLMGNLSRELNFGEKQWMTMKSNVSYAEFDVLSEVYSLTNDSIGDNVLLLPMALAIPMWRFRIAYASRCSDTDWNITMDESSLIFDAMNKTDSDQRIRIDFNDKGVVNDLLETYANGTTKFHMSLESTYDPNSNYDILITILIFSTIGVAIAIIVAVLFKKYNINVRDLFKGVKKARDAESTDPGSPAEEDDAF